MPADADHEVIDSPEALFRHLYEEHGVEEARDLDPETAPLQFWLRRHADLERAQRAARRQPEPPADRDPEPEAPSRPEPRPQPPPRSQSQPPPAPRRHPGFRDPLVEAVARTLAGRGHDEAAVRSAIRSFAGAGSGPAGEAGVRAAFVEPMLRSVAEHLLGAGGRRPPAPPQPTPATRPQPAPAAPPPQPAPAVAREEPARPEAAWAVLWADLADPGRRTAGAGAAADDGDDLMAVANAIQGRRRVKRLRR
jgi:outer membrane biosynthesis protein TonB